jgi:hypothetical protein
MNPVPPWLHHHATQQLEILKGMPGTESAGHRHLGK